MKEQNAVEYWVSEASKGRNIAECWQAIKNIIQAEKENIYNDLMRIADNGELEDMRREIKRFFKK